MAKSDLIAALIHWIPFVVAMAVILGFFAVYNVWFQRRRGPYKQAINASIEALEVNKRMLDELQEIKTLLKERGSKE